MAIDDISGQTLRSYKLREIIAHGGFGSVYRAHQSIIDRDVALKIVRPEYANNPDFIRRFEAEAQTIARLEHIHIVPLYDFWREPDGAFLVMRWLRGGNLRQKLLQGLMPLDDVTRILEQMCSALSVVHRRGVIHQDIKPENILFDEDGNAYISDFGIAKLVSGNHMSPDDDKSYGTPDYMSPESILRKGSTPQSDIYSLGIMLYEMLTGRLPFMTVRQTEIIEYQIYNPMPPLPLDREDLTPMLNAVIWKATSKTPETRYKTVLAMLDDYLNTLGIARSRGVPTNHIVSTQQEIMAGTIPLNEIAANTAKIEVEPENPYKGLRAFDESDADRFYGREELTNRFLQRIKEGRFLAVVGPSGIGKSSVVRAGVIPAMRDGAIEDSDNWFYVTITPGAHPLAELREAILRVAAAVPENFLTDREDETRLVQIAQDVLPRDKTQLVVFVDQFEEIFSLTQDESERNYFLRLLINAVENPASRLKIIVSLRADFYDRPLLYPEFGKLIQNNTEVVIPLNVESLEQTVVKPAEQVGLRLDTALIPVIVADVSKQPGMLPLLQYTLSELYEQRDGTYLTLKAYHELGGVTGALAKRADQIYQAFDEAHKEATRKLFLRLVAFDEGIDRTRQRALLADLYSDNRQITQEVLDAFGKYRLLTFDYEPLTRAPTVEVAHEALLEAWGQLREWIETNREELRIYRRLTIAAREWTRNAKDGSYLASGSRLAQFEGLLTRPEIALTDDERRYIRAGVSLRQRNVNRLRATVAVLIALVIAAAGLAVFAFSRQNEAIAARDRADQQTDIARSRQLAITALTNLDKPDLAMLLSVEAVHIADTFEADNSLLTAIETQPYLESVLHGHTDSIRTLAYSPDGSILATGGRDNRIILWDTATRQMIGTPIIWHTNWVNALVFSPDGSVLASASADGSIELWDVQSATIIGDPLLGHEGAVWTVDFSPDGKTLASGGADGTIRLWDVETQTQIGEPLEGHSDIVYSVRFHPTEANLLASGGADNTIRYWDTSTGEALGDPLEQHTNWVLTLAFSPDGEWLASAGADMNIIIWRGRNAIGSITTGHTDWIRSLAFSSDAQILASASADGSVRLWDMATGQALNPILHQPGDGIWAAAFQPDTKTLATGGVNRSAFVWTPTDSRLIDQTYAIEGEVTDVAVFEDLLAVSSVVGDGTLASVHIWNQANKTELSVIEQANNIITSIAFSPDGSQLVTGGANRVAQLWDVQTGNPIGSPFSGHGDVIWGVAFSPDGKLLATASDDETVQIWDVEARNVLHEYKHGDNGALTVAYSPDGKWLASGGRNGKIVLFDGINTRIFERHTDSVTSLQFSPDGKWLLSGSRDGTLLKWDVATGTIASEPFAGHSNWVLDVAFSPDGSRIASSSRDQTVILWDFASGRQIGTPLVNHSDWVTTVTFSVDGQHVISGGNDGQVFAWNIQQDYWLSTACQTANRNLTREEWSQFSPNITYQETCIGS